MANERPIEVPRFGAALKRARDGRMPRDVIAKMHRLSVEMEGFSRPQLDRYEAGRTWRPDPVVLYYMAQIYGADLLDWIQVLAEERTENAIREEAERGKAPPGPASARGRRASTG